MNSVLVQDEFGRRFEVLRLSVNSICNFACTYCVSEEEFGSGEFSSHSELSSTQFIRIVTALHSVLNLKTVRITGGEPTLYSGLTELIAGLKESGIAKVKLTTNGYLLKKIAGNLRTAGLDSMNISLDAMSPDVFSKMSRGKKISKTIEGIESVLDTGIPIKLNCTVVRGENDHEILPLLEFAGEKKIPIRFLELMNMGHLYESGSQKLFKENEIVSIIESRFGPVQRLERKKSSTATYWETGNGFIFGVIANDSSPFCQDCNRLRLDHRGNIFGCLSSSRGFALLPLLNEGSDIIPVLKDALSQKQKLRFRGSEMSMKAIGG